MLFNLNKNKMEKEFEKNFKYTLYSKEGKVIAQSIVSFGTEDYPFPKNWKEDSMAQLSIIEYKEEFMNSLFNVSIEEGDELDDFDDVPTPDGAFGEDWKKEMMKFNKSDLIDLMKNYLQKKLS